MPTNLHRVYEYSLGSVQYAIYQPVGEVFKAAPLNFCYLWIGASAGETATFGQLWQNAGLYVFIPLLPATDWAGLAANLYRLFDQKKRLSLRFAWVDERGENLVANINVSGNKVKAAVGFRCSQMELLYVGSSTITPVDDAAAFNFTQDGFVFAPDTFDSEASNIPLTSAVRLSVPECLFNFSMGLDYSQLASCNAGLHYYYSEEKEDPDSGTTQTYYTALNYPVLKPAQALGVQVSFDFVNPQNPTRTKIEITGDAAIPSLMSTTAGHFLQLTPQGGGSQHNGFGLVNYPSGIQSEAKLCFNLQGTYSMQLYGKRTDDGTEKQLLCGLSGTEHIGFVAGDLVDFIPGNKAYAPDFPLTEVAVAGVCSAGDLLKANDKCTTSWMQVRKSGPKIPATLLNHYYTQPQTAPLFYQSQNGQKSSFLDLFNAEAGTTDAGRVKCFPMVPYGGVANREARDMYSKFERQIINPKRKQAIVTPADIKLRDERHSQLLKSGTPVVRLITTPQGLLLKVLENDGTHTWKELTLAVNKKDKKELKITGIGAIQQSAFQTSQQFLVVSKKDSLGKQGGDAGGAAVFFNEMIMADWPFTINIGANGLGGFSNVLIFKFCPGSLADKAANSCSWTLANQFVGDEDVPALSRWISDYINRIDELVNTESSYQHIRTLVHDPNWNGILALNVDIDPKAFPDDLKGLLGGIDMSRFKAHHFGIDINTINARDGHIAVPESSSMFGLIDYIGEVKDDDKSTEEIPPQDLPDFDFKVLKLRVLFKNSNIIDFNSKVSLTVNRLFGDYVIIEDKKIKPVLLDGTYESHDGKKTYIFNARENTLFKLKSNVLKTVQFEKVQFSTLAGDKDKKDDVKSRFSVWGKMEFAKLELDALSFDQLAFGNLGIKMDFSMKDPTDRTFGFDASAMTFDMLNSKSRDNSLTTNFPIALTELLIGDGTKQPKDSYYLNVVSDLDEKSKPFAAQWYGLSFNVNLGGAGALASQVGFTARLLVGWCATVAGAEKDDFTAGLFFQLPGAGKSEGVINLQSVLKLAVGGIQLYANKDAAGRIAYLLKLNKIVMDIFGKKLPPSGNTQFFLFGDPNIKTGPVTSSLGWYASYQKVKEKI